MNQGINSRGSMIPWGPQDDDPETKQVVEHTMSLGELSSVVNKATNSQPPSPTNNERSKIPPAAPLPDIVRSKIEAANGTSEVSKPKSEITGNPSLVRVLDKGTKEVPPQRFSQSTVVGQADSRFADIGLLSNFGFYDFTSLSIRPFNAIDITKLHRSIKEQTTRLQVDTMSACITASAYDLSISDYHYLLCWQRINSYKKTPITIEYACTDEDHNKKVEDGELQKSTLENVATISMDDLKYMQLDVDKCRDFMNKFYEEHGIVLSVKRVADLVEEEEYPKELDPELVNLAGMISHKHHGVTLLDRISFLEKKLIEVSPDILSDFEDWEDISDHGVFSHIEIGCKECGSKQEIALVIDLRTFLT